MNQQWHEQQIAALEARKAQLQTQFAHAEGAIAAHRAALKELANGQASKDDLSTAAQSALSKGPKPAKRKAA